jgi:copper(I)-binding protein
MRTATRTTAAAFIAGALLLAGCGSDSDGAAEEPTTETSEAEASAIEITEVWARQSPMGTTAGAAYMDITAADDDALVGASVSEDIAGTVEIHETVVSDEEMAEDMDGEMTETTMGEDMAEDMGDDTTETTMGEDMGEDMGTMTMRPVEMIELPAGETVSLEPGGYHVMLLDLVAPLEVGDSFDIELTFESGATQTVAAEVREG